MWVIRDIEWFFPATVGTGQLQLVELTSAATFFQDTVAGSSIGNWRSYPDLRITLEPPQVIGIRGTGSPDVLISGYALFLP